MARSKLVEEVRNNIAHANLFFYYPFPSNNDKNGKKTDDKIYTYDEIFTFYLKEIIKFYNIKYNNRLFKNMIENSDEKKRKLLNLKKEYLYKKLVVLC